MSDHTVLVYESAQKVLTDIGRQVQIVLDVWHDRDLDKALKCAASAAWRVTDLLSSSWGTETKVARDGDLSLYVTTQSIVFGVIAFPIGLAPDPPGLVSDYPRLSVSEAPRMGLYCVSEYHETPQPIHRGKPTCSCESASTFSLPVPIEWSFHS